MRPNLTLRILRFTAPAILFAVGISIAVSTLTARNSIVEARGDQLQGIAGTLTIQIEAFIEDSRRSVLSWRNLETIRALVNQTRDRDAAAAATAELQGILRVFPQFQGLYLLDPEGTLIASADPGSVGTREFADSPHLDIALSGTSTVSEVERDRATGRPSFAIVAPLVDDAALVRGALMATVDLTSFTERFVAPIRVGETGYAYLLRSDGLILAHPDQQLVMQRDLRDLDFGRTFMERRAVDQAAVVNYRVDGTARMAAFRQHETTGWTVIVTAEQAEILSGLRALIGGSAVAAVAAALLATAVLWLLISRSLADVSRVAAAMQEIAHGEGDLTRGILYRRKDEIGLLVDAFNSFLHHQRELIDGVKEAAGESLRQREVVETMTTDAAEKISGITKTAVLVNRRMDTMRDRIIDSEERAGLVRAGTVTLEGHIQDQAGAVEQTTASVEEMLASLRSISQVVQEKQHAAAQLYERAGTNANQLANTGEQIDQVVELVDRIGSITTVIGRITAQTNLLAMNAAIEAAHAGDAGRGFAVVAQEIRELAANSATNSREIRELVRNIINRIRSAGETTTDAVSAFQVLFGEIRGVSDAFQEMAGTVRELSAGGDQILTAMGTLRDSASTMRDRGAHMKASVNALAEALASAAEITREASQAMETIANGTGEIDTTVGELSDRMSAVAEAGNRLVKMVQAFRTG